MSVKLFGVRIHIGVFAAAAIACLINYGQPTVYGIGFASVVLHEATHLLLMRVFGCSRPSVEILPGGVKIRDGDFARLGYFPTAVCLLGAPVVNLLAAGVFFLCGQTMETGDWFRQAAAVNLALGAVNLLPLSILDGGSALDNLLRGLGRERIALRASRLCDVLCLSAIAGLNLWTVLRRYPSAPLIVFFLYCLAAVAAGHKNKG